MDAYRYPTKRHRRRHGPQGYDDVESFRPWLRDEFTFRCVYCLEREQWTNVVGTFHLEHFRAVANYPAEELDYDNLLYACHSCNSLKGNRPVPDPLKVLLSNTVLVHADGRIEGLTAEARDLIDGMGLDDPAYRERRQLMLRIVQVAEQTDQVFYRTLLGFPEDLANLARLRPPKNTRPNGVRNSYHALRQRGKLAVTY